MVRNSACHCACRRSISNRIYENCPPLVAASAALCEGGRHQRRHNSMKSIPEFETKLPHHSLIAYQATKELLIAVIKAEITDPHLREQGIRAAQNACLNCCEGAGQVDAGKKRNAFAIARGEAVEAAGCVEIAVTSGKAR